ncbi:MAG TPA: hypothetical protein P5228_02750 [Bacteroidales bacterium]|nr:hypothetical protein [Bacteroidales bacterium]HRZ48873.1 hypothetical protein [Bacteroidales bacterium]
MKKILAILIALNITVSTSGFMVFVHHCRLHQETMSSLFVNFNDDVHHECGHNHHPAAPHSGSCCSPEPSVSSEKLSGNCCTEYEFLLRFSPDTEPARKAALKFNTPDTRIAYCHYVIEDKAPDQPEVFTGRFDDPCPAPAGRPLLITLSQLKIYGC